MDFTVSGKAVNTTARIESMCSKFDRPLLVSKEVAIHLDNEMQLISNEKLKGYESKINIFAPATS
jgi:class 3 adenylate cyclase